MFKRGISLLAVLAVITAACTSAGASSAPSAAAPTAAAPSAAASSGGASAAPSVAASVAPVAGGLLEKVLKAGVLKVSTDPNYAPQSLPQARRDLRGLRHRRRQ